MVGRVLGTLALATGAAQAAAPVVGSFILEIANWRWLFWYDLPITLSAFALARYAIPPDDQTRRRFDYVSAALCIPTLGLGFFALDRMARGPGSPLALALLAIALICGTILVRRQRGRERPLFPIDLLTLPGFALPGAISALTYGAQAMALTALPFLLVQALDMTLVQAGAMIAILPVAILMSAPVAGYLCDRFPRWPFGVLGSLVMAAGFIGIHTVAPTHDRTLLSAVMILFGIGFSLIQNHNAKAMILGAPIERVGAAGGIQSTVRVIGMMIGPALVGISFHAFGANGLAVSILMGAGLSLIAAVLGGIAALLQRHQPSWETGWD